MCVIVYSLQLSLCHTSVNSPFEIMMRHQQQQSGGSPGGNEDNNDRKRKSGGGEDDHEEARPSRKSAPRRAVVVASPANSTAVAELGMAELRLSDAAAVVVVAPASPIAVEDTVMVDAPVVVPLANPIAVATRVIAELRLANGLVYQHIALPSAETSLFSVYRPPTLIPSLATVAVCIEQGVFTVMVGMLTTEEMRPITTNYADILIVEQVDIGIRFRFRAGITEAVVFAASRDIVRAHLQHRGVALRNSVASSSSGAANGGGA